MKTHHVPEEVTRSGAGQTTAFSIKATAKSFEILSSALYSDKVKAIVRELSCNAYDSHVAAGCPERPIHVKLPSDMDDKFYVQDFGLGMSHDDVMKLYTTYFESTKTQSDDFIGQLGLGSKSPFSYAGTFNVESWFNGEKRTYVCYKDEDGFPAISLMHTEATDEGNGIRVSLACRSSDSSKFTNAAKKALMYFNPKPVFVGNDSFATYSIAHTVSGADGKWRLRDSDYYAGQTGPYIVQGFVAYPIDAELLQEAGLSGAAINVSGIDIDLFMPIGSVEVAPSREALSYDRRTTANLIAEFDRIAVELRDTFQRQFDATVTQWDARILFDKLKSQGAEKQKTLFKRMHEAQEFTWKGEPLSSFIKLNMESVATVKLTTIEVKSRRRATKLVAHDVWTPFQRDGVESVDGKWTPFYSLPVTTNTHLMVNDTGRALHRASAKAYLSQLPNSKHVIVLQHIDSKHFIDQRQVDDLMAQLDNPTVVLVSSIPSYAAAPVRRKYVSEGGSHSRRDRQEKLVWRGFGTSRRGYYDNDKFRARNWTVEKIDLEAGGFYVPTHRYMITSIPHFNPFNIDAVIANAKALGLITDDIKIVGLNEKDCKTLNKRVGKWTNIVDHVRTLFAKASAKHQYGDKLMASEQIGCAPDAALNLIRGSGWMRCERKLADGPFKATMRSIAATEKTHLRTTKEQRDSIVRLAEVLNASSSIRIETPADVLEKKWNEMLQQYELLTLINWSSVDDTDHEKIINYVNMIDDVVGQAEPL